MDMLDPIRIALDEIASRYGDQRLHLCQVQVESLVDDRAVLAGTVLDRATLQVVMATLAERFPAVAWDSAGVRVLRPGRDAVVATNLTGVYAEPSWLAEMVSQILSGTALEVLEEQERWAFVRQEDGYLGWAYRSYLAEGIPARPTHMVISPVADLRAAPDGAAALAGRLLAGTMVQETDRDGSFVQLSLAGHHGGWMAAVDLREINRVPQAGAARRAEITARTGEYVGVPYLWGGTSALGIDCSGYAQLLHRLAGVTIPRDADLQYEAGRPVDYPFQPGDLLFFGGNGSRAITHVAVSLGGWQVIHASRARNGVYQDDVQAVAGLRDSFVGARTFVA
jgi:cell wall-associated NlpC family hydrolase